MLTLRSPTPSIAASDRATALGRRTSVPAIVAMAYLKHAEAFLAKLPSISLEGLDHLGAQSPVKMQLASFETQSHQVSWLPLFNPQYA